MKNIFAVVHCSEELLESDNEDMFSELETRDTQKTSIDTALRVLDQNS